MTFNLRVVRPSSLNSGQAISVQLDQQDLTLRIAGSVTSDWTVTVTNRCGVQVGDSSVSNVDALGFSQTVTAGTTFDFYCESRLTLTIPIPASGRVECVVSAGAGSDTISITRTPRSPVKTLWQSSRSRARREHAVQSLG